MQRFNAHVGAPLSSASESQTPPTGVGTSTPQFYIPPLRYSTALIDVIKWRETNNSGRLRCIRVAIGRETKRERVLIVSYRLMQIADLAERAAAAGWCITTLAANLGVSVPTLERFFHDTKQQCPRDWINAERMRRACELLERHERIGDVADALLYGHSRNFCTAFTKYFGYSPREHLRRSSKVGRVTPCAPILRKPNSASPTPQAQLRKPNSASPTPQAQLRTY